MEGKNIMDTIAMLLCYIVILYSLRKLYNSVK